MNNKIADSSEDRAIIYHANCSDGWCSAYLCYLCFGPDCDYKPYRYGDPINVLDYKGKVVYVVDFSFSDEVLVQLALTAKRVIVLDHHATASHINDLIVDQVIEGEFCLTKSGARLTLEQLIREGYTFDNETKDLVNYVQDRDLWQFQLPYSREVNSAIRSYPQDFESWNSLPGNHKLIEEGLAIQRYRKGLVDGYVSKVYYATLPKSGELVPFVDCNCGELISDIGEILGVGHPYCVVVNDNSYSLRSRPEGMDVSVIAKSLGGGGHKHAAGFNKEV